MVMDSEAEDTLYDVAFRIGNHFKSKMTPKSSETVVLRSDIMKQMDALCTKHELSLLSISDVVNATFQRLMMPRSLGTHRIEASSIHMNNQIERIILRVEAV